MPFDIEVDMSDDLWFKEGEQKGQLKTVTRLLERLFGPSRNPRSSVLPKRPRNSLTTGTSVHTVWPAWTTFFERVDFFSPAGKTLTFLVPGSRLIQ